jgi:hypothetical protein
LHTSIQMRFHVKNVLQPKTVLFGLLFAYHNVNIDFVTFECLLLIKYKSMCTALEFLSNLRRIHSEEEDEEKEEQGLPRALICCSPTPPPFPPHTLRACRIAWGCVIRTQPPPLIVRSHGQKSVTFRKSG